MLLPRKEDSVHKAWLLRLLTEICDDRFLAGALGFKGGTAAAMRGFLNRFSVDLDFDLLVDKKDFSKVRQCFEDIFVNLGLNIKDCSDKIPQYFLVYPVDKTGLRNTIKLDVSWPVPGENDYEMVKLTEIDRVVKCQTLETMFANKLLTLIERFERTGKVAARDVFDIHQFFFRGYSYKAEVILKQREGDLRDFFNGLVKFVERHVTSTIIDQDLNYLLPNTEFQAVRKILKSETLMFLKSEIERLPTN